MNQLSPINWARYRIGAPADMPGYLHVTDLLESRPLVGRYLPKTQTVQSALLRWETIHHPCFAPFRCFLSLPDQFFVIFELPTNMARLDTKLGSGMYASNLAGVFLDLTASMLFLHHQGIDNPTFSPSKIYLKTARPLTIFGYEDSFVDRRETGKLTSLDIRYAAPELISRNSADNKADVYHIGALMFHLITGRVILPGEAIDTITSLSKRRIRREWNPLMAAVLSPNPGDRPLPKDLLAELHDLSETRTHHDHKVWLGCSDQAASGFDQLPAPDSETTVKILQTYPGTERRARINPFIRLAEANGYLVFHRRLKADQSETYQMLNDLLLLIREGVALHLDTPLSFKGFSTWEDEAELLEQWRGTAQMLTAHAGLMKLNGLIFIIEGADHMDLGSARLLPRFFGAFSKGCHIILTGSNLAKPFWRDLTASKLNLNLIHPTFPQEKGQERVIWSPENGLEEISGDLLSKAGYDECRTLHALFDTTHKHGFFHPFFKKYWTLLEEPERMVLKILAASERPLRVDEIQALFKFEPQQALINLNRFNLTTDQPAGHSISCQAGVEFARRRWLKDDLPHIRSRLLAHELSSSKPHLLNLLVQAVHLDRKSHIKNNLNTLHKQAFKYLDLDVVFAAAAVYDRDKLPCLKEFSDFAAILSGRMLKRSNLPQRATAAVKANRLYIEGNHSAAHEAFHTLANRRDQWIGLKAFALVRQAECALHLQDKLTIKKVWRSFDKLQLNDLKEWIVADLKTRMAAVLVLSGIQYKDACVMDALNPAQKAWLACMEAWQNNQFQRAAHCLEEAQAMIENHYDLTFKGLGYRRLGNIFYRNYKPEQAVWAYCRAEQCFKSLNHAAELENTQYNLAGSEKLAGRFNASIQRFQPIYAAAQKREDHETRCFILYYLMICRLYQNNVAAFDNHYREHRRLAKRIRHEGEQIKGLAARLHTALLRTKDEVRADMEELEKLLDRHEPDPLLLDECRFALRFGAFVLGSLHNPPQEPLPRLVSWRHQLLNVLNGSPSPRLSDLTGAIRDDFFGACHLFLLRTVIEADLLPADRLTPDLLDLFEKQNNRPSTDYSQFIKSKFTHLQRLDEVPKADWERGLQILESLSWNTPNPGKLKRELIYEMQNLRPFTRWGVAGCTDNTWSPHFSDREVQDPDIIHHLTQLNPIDLSGPTLAKMNVDARDSELLLLPINLSYGQGAAWFLGEETTFNFDHYHPLLRFHAKLYEWLFSPRFSEDHEGESQTTRQTRLNASVHGIVGNSRSLRDLKSKIQVLAPSSLNVYIWGESGTGKELTALALHRMSDRAGKPFRAVNCNHYTETLVEAELFGHIKGAYTGAATDKIGLLEMVDGGTLFLDEIGDISPKIQSLLLRVIQEGEFSRLGELTVRKTDIRFITATNKNIHEMIDKGSFRSDLFFRIVEEEIHLPPLRDRREDIPALAAHFAKKHHPQRSVIFTRDFFQALYSYNWPGNIREFESYVRKLLVHHPNITEFSAQHQLPFLRKEVDPITSLETLADLEMEHRYRIIEDRLIRFDGNRSAAARSLGVSRQRLASLITRQRINHLTDDSSKPGAGR